MFQFLPVVSGVLLLLAIFVMLILLPFLGSCSTIRARNILLLALAFLFLATVCLLVQAINILISM